MNFLDNFSRRIDYESTRHGGRAIQNNGPRAFYLFSSLDSKKHAIAAVIAAIESQRSIQEMKQEKWAKPFARIALNVGIETDFIPAQFLREEELPRIVSRGSFYHTATLIQNQSKALRGNSILICGNTHEKSKDKIEGSFYKKIFVRGKKDPVLVYEIMWEKRPENAQT
jgi:class 3 adenylate cyclase